MSTTSEEIGNSDEAVIAAGRRDMEAGHADGLSALEEVGTERIAQVLRLARNTLNAKGGPLASERRAATNAIARLLNDMGEYL
jgi:hypothetical protein